MFRILLILLLSVSLLFSCSKNKAKKGPSVIVGGKVKEGGCRKFDFYCKRTGRVIDSSDINVSPEPTDQEIAILIYYEAVEALKAGDAFYAEKKFREVESLMPQDKWASKASLMASYAEYSRNAYSNAIFDLERHMKHYPADKNIPYAHYLLAMCYYEQILDCLGDLMLSGHQIFGHVVTSQGGHQLTNVLLKEFLSNKSNWEFESSEGKEKGNENSSYPRPLVINA